MNTTSNNHNNENNSNFDGVIRCDITNNGVSMTWDEYKHVESINNKIAHNPWNYIVGLLFAPYHIIKMICVVIIMAHGNSPSKPEDSKPSLTERFVTLFVDEESPLVKFTNKMLKKLLMYDKYVDDEYRRIMEVPFWERHPERYTEDYKKEHDRF